MKDKISNFPIMFFAVILGLGGLGVAYAKLSEIFELSQMVGMLIKYLSAIWRENHDKFYRRKG